MKISIGMQHQILWIFSKNNMNFGPVFAALHWGVVYLCSQTKHTVQKVWSHKPAACREQFQRYSVPKIPLVAALSGHDRSFRRPRESGHALRGVSSSPTFHHEILGKNLKSTTITSKPHSVRFSTPYWTQYPSHLFVETIGTKYGRP